MKKYWILFLSVFFCGCNHQPKTDIVKFQAEELEVIKQTFYDATCCYVMQMEYNFKSDINESFATEHERFRFWADSVYQHLPEKLIWLVKDTLYNPKDFDSKISYRHDPQINSDTSFTMLEKQLFTVKYPKQSVKLNNLIIGNYVFNSVASSSISKEKPERYVTFSRVVFNLNHTKACYYISQSLPDHHWADGEMIFAEKKANKWFLKYRKLYWIT